MSEFTVRMRRIFGGDSPMNVWRKQFTETPNALRDSFLQVRNEARLDVAFLRGDKWPAGTVLNIRKPARIAQ